MENVEEYKGVTLYAKDKEQAHRLVEELFSEDKPVKPKGSFWSTFGFLLGRIGMVLVKLLLFLVLTPFFLFTLLKNMFFLGIGLTVSYWLIGQLYTSFIEQKYYTPDDFNRMMFTNTKLTILIAVVVIFALLAAIYDYEDQFETVFSL